MIKYCLNKKSLGGMCWFERKERYVVCIYNLELKLFVVEGNNFFLEQYILENGLVYMKL
jgi:hypothetical protein